MAVDPITNPEKIPQEYYKIDLSQINDIAPEHYRISGTTQSINGIISDVTELMQHDYFITLEKDPNEGKLETPAIIADEDGKAMSTKILKSTGKTREYTVNGEKKGGLTEEELLEFWQEGDDGGGLITNPNIKVVAISKGAQPAPGVIRSLVDDFKEREILMSSSIGQELQDDTTQKLIIGGPASRLVTRFIEFAYPIWAKGKDSKYFFDLQNNKSGKSYKVGDRYNKADKRIPIWVDPFGPMSSYNATIFELRMATGGRDSWQTFKVFESVFNDTYDDDPWCVDIDIDKGTLEVLAAGNRGAMSLAATKQSTSGKAFNTDFQTNFNRGAAEYTDKLFSAIQNTANNFYGKMFALPMPFEPGGQDNNLRWIQEDQKYEATWEAVDSAFCVADKFDDISFYTSEGRVKTFVEWTHNSNRDFSVLGSSYARFSGNYYNQNEDMLYTDSLAGVASTGCNIEKSHFWPDFTNNNLPDAMPFVVMNAGERIVEYDKFTTPDFGLTVLAYYFFGIEILPERYIGPGKANTHINIPPNVVLPNSFGVAQQSHRYVWGPWYGGTLDGKTEVIEDESLVPETFGSVEGMNQAGETLANVGNAEMTGSETGYVEIAEFPSYNIAERFAGSGPYVSDMSFTIDTGGFKTTYKFNTWTPQFGKLAKYNIDRISRINKASLALLQREREKIEKRPLFPPTPRMTADDLVRRLASSRQDVSLSLGQIFPPGGDLDGTWEVSDVSVSDLGALAEGGGVYNKVAGTSKDSSVIPVHISRDKDNVNENMPSVRNPNVQGEAGKLDGILPNSKTNDPFFSSAVNDGDSSETFSRLTLDGLIVDPVPENFSADHMSTEDKKNVTAVRVLATSLPRIAAGFGYDVAYNPVPNDGENLRKFDPTFQKNPALRKAGPINLLWDEERKIWSGGLEILGGVLDGEITPATSPTDPSEFKVKVFRKVSNTKGKPALADEGEIIDCYNRDTALSASGENIWVIVVRLNYEWTPLWVSCK